MEELSIVSKYLSDLKNANGYSFKELSSKSGIPESTIRKILEGYTPDPRLDTAHRILVAMGGSFDEMFNGKRTNILTDEVETLFPEAKEINNEHVDISKSALVERIEEIKLMFREQIITLKEQIVSLKSDKKKLSIIVCILMAFIIALFTVDTFAGSIGWIRR